MKYFFDTEFAEDGKTIDLISIGIISENGHEFYRVSNEFNVKNCNDWVTNKVLPLLPSNNKWISRSQLKKDILEFIGSDKPEFWAYYADYDWVVLCQLFGTMLDLPDGWPMYCKDIKQLCDELGNPRLPDQKNEHDALADAKWNVVAYNFLIELK